MVIDSVEGKQISEKGNARDGVCYFGVILLQVTFKQISEGDGVSNGKEVFCLAGTE